MHHFKTGASVSNLPIGSRRLAPSRPSLAQPEEAVMTKNPCATRRAALRGLLVALCVAIPAIASNRTPEVISVQPATIDDGAIALYGIIRGLSDRPNAAGMVLAVQVTAADAPSTTALRQNARGEPCPDCTTTHYFLVRKPDEVTPKILKRRAPGPVTYIHIRGREYVVADIRLTWAGDGTPGLKRATLLQTGFAPPIFKRRVEIRFEASLESGRRAGEIANMAMADAMERERRAQQAYEAAVRRHSQARDE